MIGPIIVLLPVMNNLQINIREFASALHGDCMDNDITILKIDHFHNAILNNALEEQFFTRLREKVSCSFYVFDGEISATIDYKTIKASKNTILGISPIRILTHLQASENFCGYILLFSKNFIEETALNRNPPISISQILSADVGPCRKMTSLQMNLLKICLDRVLYYLKHTEHRLRKELVQNTFYTFILETINILFEENPDKSTIETSVKKQHIQKFMELLIAYGEKERNPSFYADKLCISVQYLSLILKEVSGKTANAWIANFLITRAKTMLRKPDMTIQQITEILNFSDQSSFGKFFKKHVGISPKKYRESHMSI